MLDARGDGWGGGYVEVADAQRVLARGGANFSRGARAELHFNVGCDTARELPWANLSLAQGMAAE